MGIFLSAQFVVQFVAWPPIDPTADKMTFVEFTLRDADSRDFETLWCIDQECFEPGIAYSRRELAAYMALREAFSIVVTDWESKIVGFLVATTRRNREGHIITIDVLSEARRAGVGSMLLTAAEERLRKRNCRSVHLETAVDNRSALNFYKRHNYSTVKIVPHFYANGVDALVLQKDLLSTAQAS